ncbi:MAG: 2'-5' RNA ligase family protein [Balneolaceae bacterium]
MLYFLALIPPKPLKDQIHKMKLGFKEHFNSAHSLKAPPHITLLSPFRLNADDKEELEITLKKFSQDFKPFDVQLKNFSHFESRVIFIDVKKEPTLINLQLQLEKVARSNPHLFNYNYDERPYHPHLTLAFKDLTAENFKRAWDEFRKQTFDASFFANSIYLLKHNGNKWEVDREFVLGG